MVYSVRVEKDTDAWWLIHLSPVGAYTAVNDDGPARKDTLLGLEADLTEQLLWLY